MHLAYPRLCIPPPAQYMDMDMDMDMVMEQVREGNCGPFPVAITTTFRPPPSKPRERDLRATETRVA